MHFANENAGRNATRGVRIVFAGSDGVEKTLYYFSTDLSNSGVKSSGFLKFCETLAPGNSLIKSASYLLHSGNFSTVRDFLLANSATIIQDDSGIPLAYYNPKKWRFFPFGRYAGPIDEFPGRYQEEYAELFRRSQPMDFGIGYRWRSYESNLLLSVRLPDDGSTSPSRRHRLPNRHSQNQLRPRQAASAGPIGQRRRFLLVFALKRSPEENASVECLHHRTLWLGTIKAVVARCFGVAAEESAGGDDDNEQVQVRRSDRSVGDRAHGG